MLFNRLLNIDCIFLDWVKGRHRCILIKLERSFVRCYGTDVRVIRIRCAVGESIPISRTTENMRTRTASWLYRAARTEECTCRRRLNDWSIRVNRLCTLAKKHHREQSYYGQRRIRYSACLKPESLIKVLHFYLSYPLYQFVVRFASDTSNFLVPRNDVVELYRKFF